MRYILTLALLATLPLTSFAGDAEKQQKAEQLLALTKADKLLDSVYAQMEGMMSNMTKNMDIDPGDQDLVKAYYSDTMSIMKDNMSWAKLKPLYMQIYSNNFSEQELDDYIAFYKTSSGQALVQKMPVVMQQSMTYVQSQMRDIMPKIMDRGKKLQADLQARHAKDAKQ